MINMKTSTATTLNRTLSFKPMPITTSSPSLANVENTPIKIIPIQTINYECNRSNHIPSNEEKRIVEETPVKEEDNTSDTMAREIQRLSLRMRSSNPMYNVPVLDHQPVKPATLHLSQVVNRVSRCHYVLRRYVREAEKFSPKPIDKRPASQPVNIATLTTTSTSIQSQEKGRRRLFVDSPRQENPTTNHTEQTPTPVTPRKASGVIKQLFASPCSSSKRALPSPSQTSSNVEKRPRLF